MYRCLGIWQILSAYTTGVGPGERGQSGEILGRKLGYRKERLDQRCHTECNLQFKADG